MGHLTREQRYVISALRTEGMKLAEIGTRLGRDKSVISRELRRNCDARSKQYSADLADRKSSEREAKKKKHKRFTPEIEGRVRTMLENDYSPEQIAGWSKKNGVDCVSHETIYRYVYTDKKKKGTLHEHLRRKGRRYRKRGAAKDRRGMIKNRVSIAQRPEIVDDRSRFGDLEGDLIMGKGHEQALVTINDRRTGMVKIAKVDSKHASVVREAITEMLQDWLPYIHTITFDNGKEFADHVQLSDSLGIDCYFARPYHSWERGSNENLNGLIRQYIPKKTDFKTITEEQVKAIENKLNNRPRKRFQYETPIFEMNQLLFYKLVAFVT